MGEGSESFWEGVFEVGFEGLIGVFEGVMFYLFSKFLVIFCVWVWVGFGVLEELVLDLFYIGF